ncbi:MAG: EF-hand domain-containing protein [Verrucomicrobiota bacterium]
MAFAIVTVAFTANSYANMADHPKIPKSRPLEPTCHHECHHHGMRGEGEYKHHPMNPDKIADQILEKFDKNHDGFLDRDEIKTMIQEHHHHDHFRKGPGHHRHEEKCHEGCGHKHHGKHHGHGHRHHHPE